MMLRIPGKRGRYSLLAVLAAGVMAGAAARISLTAPPSTPIPFPPGEAVTAVAGNEFGFVALARRGTVYAWGDNRIPNMLGTGGSGDRPAPVRGLSRGGVQAIATGDGISLALTGDGEVYIWGNVVAIDRAGKYTYSNAAQPVGLLPRRDPVRAIAAGWGFTSAYAYGLGLTRSGRVYWWRAFSGRASWWRAYRSGAIAIRFPRGEVVTALATEGNCGLALTARGMVYGFCEHDDQGMTSRLRLDAPRVLGGLPKGDPVVAMATTEWYSLFLTRSGKVYAAEVGEAATAEPLLTRGDPVRAIAGSGRMDSLAITRHGEVHTWYFRDWCTARQVVPCLAPVGMHGLPSGATVQAIVDGPSLLDPVALTRTGQVYGWRPSYT